MNYVAKYKITSEKLAQQSVNTEITEVSTAQYETWMRDRAQRLAEEGNAFLQELRG